ncbi:MAG: hypothetical protein ACWA5W_00330 [Phycisphaerales bacterium]
MNRPRPHPHSRTISGTTCLIAICAPLLIAPFQLTQSLDFVRTLENRTPHEFPAAEKPRDLIDATWWSKVSSAIEDRVPYRQQVIALNRTINPSSAKAGKSNKVVRGIAEDGDQWLFFRKSLAEDLGTLEETKQAIDTIEHFMANNTYKADLFIVVAPNKVTIYPEKLPEDLQLQFAQSKQQRALLRDYFARPDTPYLIDIWTPIINAKHSSPELLYEPASSHYNSHGAMILAKAMIDAGDPTLWDDSEIIEEWTKTDIPDIAKIIGDWDIKETNTRLQIHRPGIEIVELWQTAHKKGITADKPTRVDNPDFLTINALSYYNRRHVINRSVGEQLIPGKTLILFDSFIGLYLHPTLSQFFEDVEFIHIGTVDQAFFKEALNTYDRVYFQSAERHIIPRAIEFFGD